MEAELPGGVLPRAIVALAPDPDSLARDYRWSQCDIVLLLIAPDRHFPRTSPSKRKR